MEIIIGLIILVILMPIIGLMVLGAFGIGWFATSERRAKRQAADAAQQFVEKFDGDSRVVTFEYSSLREHPTKEEIIEAADTFDYRLTNSSENRYGATLVFEKRADE
ncbi:MAG: hypothetical protein QJR09_07980 [Micrococcus sp.]|nr:hypothetical protein [Micrococcus sp.]